jgi:hypothetical protein
MSNLSTYYSFNQPDVNLNGQIQNWVTGSPVYDASLNGGAYISRNNYKTGNGSLEMQKNTFLTPLPTTLSTITISSNSNVKFCISSDKLILIYCGFPGGNVFYKIRNAITDSWPTTNYTFSSTSNNFYSMAMTPDKSHIVFAENGGTKGVYFTKNPVFNGSNNSNTYTRTSDTTQRGYFSIAISRDGSRIVATTELIIYYANWNATNSNYNIFTQTLETKTHPGGQYMGISISSNGDRIVYGNTSGPWYLSFWNGTNYNSGTLIYNVGTPRNSFFNSDASLLFFSFYGTNIKYLKFNNNTNSYDYVDTISMGSNDCHGLQCIDSTSNMTIYSLGYNTATIYHIDLSYNTTNTNYCMIKSPTINTNGLTIACWFRSNYNSNNARIFDFATANTATSNNIRLFINNNELQFDIYTTVNNTSVITGNINDNNWNHIAITMSYSATPNTSTITAYINGSGANTYSGKSYPAIISRPYCYLGRSNTSGDPPFLGNIDDFRVYNSVLTPMEILTLYNNTNVTNNYTNSTVYRLYDTAAESTSQITPNTNLNVGSSKTYYYWNDPYATTNTIINKSNPYNFYYTYNNTSSLTSAKVSIITNELVTLKLNGVQTNILNSGNTFASPVQVPLAIGNNLFEFITYNNSGPAYFAAYVTDNNATPNYLFSTKFDTSEWKVNISGLYSGVYPVSSLLVNDSTSTPYTTASAITTATNYNTFNLDLSSNKSCKRIKQLNLNFISSNNNDLANIFFSYP